MSPATTYGLFIDGEERPAAGGATFPVTAPETGALVGHAARGGPEDANAAALAAARAFAGWAGMAPEGRERALLRTADVLERKLSALSELIVDESGSTLAKARHEVTYAGNLLRAAAGEARRLYGETFPNDNPHRLSMVLREPLGVVAVISPFNSPLALHTKMVAFPLAAGNTIVTKPSEETPLVAVELGKALAEGGVPAGVVNVLTGYGVECGDALIRHPKVAGIAFTGSTATGSRIGGVATSLFKRVQLELGGKNPLIVLGDVDIDEAAAIAAHGAFYHAGQICMASARVLVERRVARSFAEALAKKADSLYLGDLRDPRTAYGPLIHEGSLRKVRAHVDEAVSAGAELLAGGQVARGLVYRPTVLWEPPRTTAVWREETFGPVVSVTAVEDLEEAIAVANESDYGLSAAILTRDVRRAFTAARRLRTGSVHIGMHSFQSNALAPIGGVGASGIGRSGGKYSVEEFTELKWVSLELGDPPL
jgi:acyl-CoA reductase-like NAD-dependent aldehyde dehydrogenase